MNVEIEAVCKTKQAFPSAQAAYAFDEQRRNRKWRKEQKRIRLKAYKCPVCSLYHLTSIR